MKTNRECAEKGTSVWLLRTLRLFFFMAVVRLWSLVAVDIFVASSFIHDMVAMKRINYH